MHLALICLIVGPIACDDPTGFGSDTAPIVAIELEPASLILPVGGSSQLQVSVRDSAGRTVSSVPVTLESSSESVATVSTQGLITAVSPGTAIVTATVAGKSAETVVTVNAPPDPSPPPVGTEFITGVQLPLGQSPWPFYDANQADMAGAHHATAMSTTGNDFVLANYYDLPLALYTLHARSGSSDHLNMAREAADAWFANPQVQYCNNDNMAPRHSGLSGLMLRAMDGRPEMWECITKMAREHYNVWLGLRLSNPTLHYGVRDGGFALLHTAQLARVHPDEAVRDEMADKALAAARDYYARLQRSDGGWYWVIDEAGGEASQPFMIGMLLEGLIATHQLTPDATVGQSITRAVNWLYNKAYERHLVSNLDNIRWRSMKYFLYEANQHGNDRTTAFKYDMPDGAMRDQRQLNATSIHAFGYAFHITGDPKFRDWGDDVFAATFGKGQGTGADPYWGLADFRAKEYNQSYRSAGRYLYWRK